MFDPTGVIRMPRQLSLRSRFLVSLLAVIVVAETAIAVSFYNQEHQHSLNDRLFSLAQQMHRLADTQIGATQTAQGHERHEAIDARIRAARQSAEAGQTEAFRDFLLGSGISAAMALVLAFLLARSLRRPVERLESGARERRMLLDRVIGAQEDERQRIAREMHDETGQSLTALGLGLEAATAELRSGSTQNLEERLQGLVHVASEAIQELGRFVLDLRPAQLDHLGLVAALRWYASRVRSQAGLALELTVHGQARRIDPQLETALFRIAQEAINNVVRHAAASRAEVALTFEPGLVTLEVGDDGIGFDPATGIAPSSLGLIGMRERAELAGGTLTVRSRPGEGTRVTAVAPLRGGPRR